jgi:TPR repeat protein
VAVIVTKKELLVEAELGFLPAQYQVGAEYYADRDFANAAAWYQKAAEGGFAPAQAALGDLYSEGLGVEKNEAIAADWYCNAAEQGHPHAVSILLRKPPGATSPEILPRALVACQKAASDGNGDALCWLGIAHEQGIGVEKDSPLAARLYYTAAVRGRHGQARSMLRALASRDSTAAALARSADEHFEPSRQEVSREPLPTRAPRDDYAAGKYLRGSEPFGGLVAVAVAVCFAILLVLIYLGTKFVRWAWYN